MPAVSVIGMIEQFVARREVDPALTVADFEEDSGPLPEPARRAMEALVRVECAFPPREPAMDRPRSEPPISLQLLAILRLPEEDQDRALSALGADHPEVARDLRDSLGWKAEDTGSEEADRVVGPYRLVRQLGRGGFGTVWLAEQESPVRRHVALKMINPGRDTREVLARFDAERQALARLDHPCVAKVFDAGVTARGRPFFVMEHVPGPPIPEFCDREGLGVRERIDLFLLVCDGVRHAHQKGLIHRDLTARNVLVLKTDDRLLPKIIDFGIAKSLHERLLDGSLVTLDHEVLGTPEYMSPEQALSSGRDIDTRADVYSLGVLLYELLTGTLPIPSERLRRGTAGEREQVIRTWEPEPPSRRARVKHPSCAKLLAGDLDVITLKAMAKERDRRYGGVVDLADDLRRHLRHEPVLARPPSAAYFLGRLVRRHRAGFAAGAAVVLAVLAGIAVSLVSYLEAAAAAADADRKLARYDLIADVRTLQRLSESAEDLWPDVPVRILPLRSWLQTAETLAEKPGRLREALLALGEDPQESFLRERLTRLLGDLEEFQKPGTGLADDVRARLRWAERIRRETVEECADAWTDALRSIEDPAECPSYRGLHLRPQPGLIPLGRDPSSDLWEFAHLRSGDPPHRAPDGRFMVTEETGIVLVLIPGGTFRMGNQHSKTPDQPGWDTPLHDVTLGPFLLSKYELTQGQWQRLAGGNPSAVAAGQTVGGVVIDLRHPVEHVSHEQCSRLLARCGLALPTESQWEFACRAGTRTTWSTGTTAESLEGFANIGDVSRLKADAKLEDAAGFDDGHVAHAPAGAFRSNGFGLHDVHGNVWEICRDTWGGYDMPWRAGDGERVVPTPGDIVIRGGSMGHNPVMAACAMRQHIGPGSALRTVGVRPSRSLE